MFVFQLITVLLSLAIAAPGSTDAENTSCSCVSRNCFTQIGNNQYLIVERAAANFCRANNADLVNLQSGYELNALSDYLISTGTSTAALFWIDGYDLAQQGNFYSLATGLPMIFQRWSAGQPDNWEGNEHCVLLWFREGSFKMDDSMCTRATQSICKARNCNQPNIHTFITPVQSLDQEPVKDNVNTNLTNGEQ